MHFFTATLLLLSASARVSYCQAQEWAQLYAPTRPPTTAPTKSPTGTAIGSWDLAFKSLSSNFTKDSDDEITLNYNIGKGRTFDVNYLTDCKDGEAINVTYTAANSTTPVYDDASLDELELTLDIVKESISGSNVWDAATNSLKLCVSVDLLSDVTGDVVKNLERDIIFKWSSISKIPLKLLVMPSLTRLPSFLMRRTQPWQTTLRRVLATT